MSPKAKEHRSAGDVVDESCDGNKKLRRVSFSHTTHVFNYNLESESPASSNPGGSFQPEGDEVPAGFLVHQSQGDDSAGSAPDEDFEEDAAQLRFVSVMDSSSPGSAVGSVTSNEDENFFGPVSKSFINSGRLSESGMSDDMNCDITLDSTAFSMHFKNVAPLDDHSANSAGSLRTPSGDTTPIMPPGFLFQGSETEKLTGESFAVKMNNVLGDETNVKNPSSYDYGKLSMTLESLIDQVNCSMQSNAPNDNCTVISSNCDPAKISGNKKLSEKEVQCCDQNSFGEQSAHHVQLPSIPMGQPTSETLSAAEASTHNVQFSSIPMCQPASETLSTAEATGLTDHSNDEIQVLVSPTCSYGFKDIHNGTHTDIVVVNGQNSKMLSPPNGELQDDSNIRSTDSQLELFRNLANDVEFSPDLSSVTVPQLDAASILLDTPKLAAKLFNSSLQQWESPTEDQEQQQLLCSSDKSSPKVVPISPREEPASPMQTPNPAVKSFHFSALEGFISSLQDKVRKLPDFSDLSWHGLRQSPSKQVSSLQMEFIKQGRRISAIKNRIAGSSVKSRMQFDYEHAISMKDHFTTDVDCSLDKTKANTWINPSSNSDVHAADAFETPEKGHSENRIERNHFHCNNLAKQLCTRDTSFSLVEKRIAGLKELNNILYQKELCDAGFSGDREKQQACNMENAGGTIGNCSITALEIESDSEIVPARGDTAKDHADKSSSKHWTDVHLKVSDGINQLLPESISELCLHQLKTLEDHLEELQTKRKYARLCTTLENHASLTDPLQRRVEYARSLIETLGFAKLRSKLKRIKLNKLQNEAEILRSKVEECSKLKSMYSMLLFSKKTIGLHESYDSSHQEERHKVAALEQELQTLEERIKTLLQYFKSSCNLKGEMSIAEVIEAVKDHIMRRNLCMEIQERTQLWRFSNIVANDDRYEVVLSYCKLLYQSFIISKVQNSSIVTRSICDTGYVRKKYPNMDADIAFEFVFNLSVDRTLSFSKGICVESVGTNLLLGTLLEVLDEMFLSRVELMNLLSSTFAKCKSGELELQLCFISPECGRKLVCGLDMSILNCGIYPGDPPEKKIRVDKKQTTLPSGVVERVLSAVRSLHGGQQVILRLCRCISHLLLRS